MKEKKQSNSMYQRIVHTPESDKKQKETMRLLSQDTYETRLKIYEDIAKCVIEESDKERIVLSWANELLHAAKGCRHFIEKKNASQAAFTAMQVTLFGERIIASGFAPAVKTGGKIRQGGKEGHEQVYGNAEQKAARYSLYQEELDKARKEFPDYGIVALREVVAGRMEVSAKTIQRHTT